MEKMPQTNEISRRQRGGASTYDQTYWPPADGIEEADSARLAPKTHEMANRSSVP